ncbi:uncharacterized protein LOC113075981 [Carassius auratus]|uniref:Uncharacterized protein LOC113075981 n=1 Tax=Carassius auratus TaxID=7957 RepID=A0A6P6N851_CARAU|nr:uncharacterized protein LOC113075981 [Carassius auratus]
MPELSCEACQATWTAGVGDLNLSDYWPATLHFATIYATDVFFSFEEMKMAAPGLSCQAFLRMLDQRTVRFGRCGKISKDSFQKSFFEWEAVRYEVDKICKEEPFICPACSPDMLAVSVDGNRKHYRFKNAARSEEKAIFEDVFIAKDEDVTRFVDYIHKTSKHVKKKKKKKSVCGGEWSAARETSQGSASKVDEEGLEVAVFRHGVLLCALNMAHRHADSHGHALESAKDLHFGHHTDPPISEDHKSSVKPLLNLESLKVELAVTESQLEDWLNEVKEWADTAATTTTNDADALASRIEVLVASIKRRSQRLYKDTDGNKGRARIRRKIREEKGTLTSIVEKYNRMVPNTETLCLETILSGETAWPWQLPHSDSVNFRTKRKAFDIMMSLRRLQEEQKILVAEMNNHWRYLSTRADALRELSCCFAKETIKNSQCGLTEEGLKGLQCIIHRKQRKIRDMRVQARDCYLQVLTGAENTNFFNQLSADDYNSDFDISDDEL